jgi:hypothetical protein
MDDIQEDFSEEEINEDLIIDELINELYEYCQKYNLPIMNNPELYQMIKNLN